MPTASHQSACLPRVAVGAVVIKDQQVLLVKREGPPHEGLWTIPGGCVEWGESLQLAAEREILEETGITISAKDPVHSFDLVQRDGNQRILFHYVIVDLLADYVAGNPTPLDGVRDAMWVGVADMDKLAMEDETRRLIERLMQ